MRAVQTVVVSMAVLSSGAWAGAPGSDKPVWHGEFAAAQAQARREHRPILAVLH